MHAEQIVATVRAGGGQIVLVDGNLKVKHIKENSRILIKKHRLEIIRLLKKGSVKPAIVNPHLNPCYSCDGLDLINGDNGGFFCMVCQPYIRPGIPVVAGGKRLATDIKGDDPRWYTPADDYKNFGQLVRKKLSSSFMIAHKWIGEHKKELLAAGWTSAELYRGNKSRGIAWLTIWDKPHLEPSLLQNGSIMFLYFNKTGNLITQSAFPQREKKVEDNSLGEQICLQNI